MKSSKQYELQYEKIFFILASSYDITLVLITDMQLART